MFKQLIWKIRLAILLTVSIAGVHTLDAQSTPQQVMMQVYKTYDSLSYISFDVRYVYGTDTLNGNFKNEVMQGSYTMAGKKAKYSIGDIDFMQNDSFFIAVYNKDKFIVVADPRTSNAGKELPLRQVMDSLISSYGQHYTITTDNTNGVLQFTKVKADPQAQFNSFTINYNPVNYFLNYIEYNFQTTEPLDTDAAQNDVPVYTRQKKLRVEFSNYRIDNFSGNVYSENNYIWFEAGECKPVDKYKDYKVYYSRSR